MASEEATASPPSALDGASGTQDPSTALSDAAAIRALDLSASSELIVAAGPVAWIILCLSVVATAIVLWKVWRFAALGVWRRARVERAIELWRAGARTDARETLLSTRSVVGTVARTAMARLADGGDERTAREETERVARAAIGELRIGLRGLEIIAATAPLLGLLGTVIGMIDAFQALQTSGGRADPSALAGGIWEALLTTALGMAVAIPAGIALAWCESVVDGVRLRIEDAATRVFVASSAKLTAAA